jgi:LacI family transcriptional regulator
VATISDVSRKAGVSRSTVSRLIAGSGYVSESARSAVEAAIRELGYRPNTLAQALRSNRSNMIGAVVVDVGTPYFANMVYGLQRACRGAGKSLMVISGFADQDQESKAIIELIDRSCDGIVLYLEKPLRPDVVEMIELAQIPVVMIGRDGSPMAQGVVMLDNIGGAVTAIRFLLDRGHTKIVHLSGQPDFGDTIARLEGIRILSTDSIRIVTGEFSEEFGYSATKALLDERYDFTAIFAGDDDMAAGVLMALRDAGKSVPGDISVIGFDDTFHAKHLWPPLTTIRQPVDVMGQAAAEQMIKLLSEPQTAQLRTLIGTSLIRRDSVGWVGV